MRSALFEEWLFSIFPIERKSVEPESGHFAQASLTIPVLAPVYGEGLFAEQNLATFEVARRAGLDEHGPDLSTSAFRRPARPQLEFTL